MYTAILSVSFYFTISVGVSGVLRYGKMWVFGYGSLLWKTDFPFVKVVAGTVRGYERRFWQLSPDHRGTPEAPGRTVTLIEVPQGTCWGVAYKVPEEEVEATVKYLDHREKAGYSAQQVEFFPDDGSDSFKVCVYISPPEDNEWHAGETDLETVAHEILRRQGPSGSNLEYALKVADVLHKQAPHYVDDHVFALEKRLLQLSQETGLGKQVLKRLGYIRMEE